LIFTELRFLGFFVVALAVHWALRGSTARKAWLLVCSYAFYAAWRWEFLSLIVASTLVDYLVGCKLDTTEDRRSRKRWLLLSLTANLGLLGVFKYFNFFVESGVALAGWLGLPVSETTFAIVLPVGISFYTFQTMSYSIDVYGRKLAPTRNLLDLALFVGFFPQLVAGPIVRARDFLPQLGSPRVFGRVRVRACLMLFLVGFIKKAAVSDSIAPTVDAYFASPASYDAYSALLGTWLYAVQIYCDFSGYSDMAIGCAGLLGYNLCENFAFPYFACDIQSFWRRWHMSLSSWLRDYLYIPLGGSRGSTPFTYRNLMLTMLLGGLWHGAAWRFVVWGGLHGVALVAHKQWSERLRWRLPWAVGAVVTFWWVCLAWIFFRATDVDTAWTVTKAYVLLDSPGTELLGDRLVWVVAGLGLLHGVAYKRLLGGWAERLPTWGFTTAYAAASALALALIHPHAEAFIYFQF